MDMYAAYIEKKIQYNIFTQWDIVLDMDIHNNPTIYLHICPTLMMLYA